MFRWAGIMMLAWTMSAVGSENLLTKTFFEGKTPLAGWTLSLTQGSTCTVVRPEGTNIPVVRVSVPAGGTPHWNMVSRPVPGLRAGTPYTVSAWVRTDDLPKGSFAYLSLNCFSGSHRLAANDSDVKQSRRSGWRRIVHTIPTLPPGTQQARFVMCVYGPGTVSFTQPQVEAGRTVSDYAPAPGDSAARVRRIAQERAAQTWRRANGFDPGSRPRIAVLDLGLPAAAGTFGFPSDPAVFERVLGATYRVRRVSGEELCNPSIFSSSTFDLLIVPTGSAFPTDATEPLIMYLSEGGPLLTCGGYAFDAPVVRTPAGWVRQQSAAGPVPTGTDPIVLPASMWQPSGDVSTRTTVTTVTGPEGVSGIEIATPSMKHWATATAAFPQKGRTAWSVISFRAKGGPETKRMWFELTEADQSRWHCALDLTEDWQTFCLTPDRFVYWSDNTSVGRGSPGDTVRFRHVRSVCAGVALDIVGEGLAHRVFLADLRTGSDPQAALRARPIPQINTRTGHIRDAIHPRAEQVGLFDPSFELRRVVRAETSTEMSGLFPAVRLDVPLAGFASIGPLGVNGHGFGPNRACFRALLDTFDANGQACGPAGALIHHNTGTFAGSSWAFFGTTNTDLFAAGTPVCETLLGPLVHSLLTRFHLHDTAARWAYYHPGETAKLCTGVSNFSEKQRNGKVRFILTDESGRRCADLSVPIRCAAGETRTIEQNWPVPSDAPDFLFLTAELSDGERTIDREGGAFVIRSPSVCARGPKLRKEGLRLTIDGQSHFFMGCQTFWGQHDSVTASSPLAFYRDFRMMRALGLRWTRCFLPFRTEKEKRDSDAVVQLAQKFGLVLYHTPNLSMTDDAAKNAEENAVMTELAERYRDIPGLAIDICNEPALPGTPSRASAASQRTWAASNRAAFHKIRPDVPVSVGWSQGWGGGKVTKDPQTASLDLDFTDRHYYGPPERMPPEAKDLDLRVFGKPLILGECGAKNHPTFKTSDPWGMGDDDDGYHARFRCLVSRAFGMGATALLSWHWRDPIEGIFPCGLVHPTGVPRPAAAVFARMANVFGRLDCVDNPPDTVVILDEAARDSSDRAQVIEAAHRVDEALMWHGANFSTVTSSLEKALPAGVRLVIHPSSSAFVSLRGTALRDRIGAELTRTGAFRARVSADPESVEVYYVPGKGAAGWVFRNGGNAAAEVERNGFRLTVGASRVGFLQISDGGKCLACEEL